MKLPIINPLYGAVQDGQALLEIKFGFPLVGDNIIHGASRLTDAAEVSRVVVRARAKGEQRTVGSYAPTCKGELLFQIGMQF